MPVTPANPPRPGASRMPWFGLALLACAVLALAGGILQRHALSFAAVSLLLVAWLPRTWRMHSTIALAAWLVLALLLLVPAALGRPELALMAVPVVFLAAAAWLFARTLGHGAEPLVARFIRVVEGDARLALPGVRGYARGVTVFWACLLAAMACLSLAIALLAWPGGWLAALGVASPVHLPGALLVWYPELGCWVVLVAAFAGEYFFRRWRLRGIPHPGMRHFVTRLVQCWPTLVRGGNDPA